jgi:hypothetical protein
MDVKLAEDQKSGKPSPAALRAALDDAAGFDETLRVSDAMFDAMLTRFVPSIDYSRDLLFRRLIEGEPAVMKGIPAPTRGLLAGLPADEIAPQLLAWMLRRRSRTRYRVYGGKGSARRYLTLREAAESWSRGQAVFGVADLHIRDTVMEEIIDPDALAPFNLLTIASPDVQLQEMNSLVISSRGYVTDSHSDDPDSTNYCFTGRKLWVAWETQEGLSNGLEDVEHLDIKGRARFDLQTWVKLDSARWFLVGPGETLYFPAHLTHKVVTIEPYLGVGGFFFCLPGAFRVLSHWLRNGPLWSKHDRAGRNAHLVDEIADVALKTMHQPPVLLDKGQDWGRDCLGPAAERFLRSCTDADLGLLRATRGFSQLLDRAAVGS